MSRENVDITKRAIVAFNARDIDGFVALTTLDFEWSPSMSAIENEMFIGGDGIRKYFDALSEAWEHFHVIPDRFLEQADCVLVLGELEGRGKGSGITVNASLGMAFDLRARMISRIRGYLDHDEALKAVGLDI
jgi:ketosteroid isomerase-like protein